MRTARALFAIILAAPAVLAVSPASAAAPSNDVFVGATDISFGFSEELDTTEATTDADDAALNADCGAPATDASVWYSYTPTSDGGVIVDVSASTYSAGVIVATGSPGSFSVVTCGPGAASFFAATGTTYSILAFDDQFDGGGNGGTLGISLAEAPDAPTVEVVLDPIGRVDARTGTATLTGTFSCTDADFLDVFGQVTQSVGRFTVSGGFEFFSVGECDGTATPFSVVVTPFNGKFAGGKSVAVAISFACGSFECSEGYTEQRVMLRGGRK